VTRSWLEHTLIHSVALSVKTAEYESHRSETRRYTFISNLVNSYHAAFNCIVLYCAAFCVSCCVALGVVLFYFRFLYCHLAAVMKPVRIVDWQPLQSPGSCRHTEAQQAVATARTNVGRSLVIGAFEILCSFWELFVFDPFGFLFLCVFSRFWCSECADYFRYFGLRHAWNVLRHRSIVENERFDLMLDHD
jgi:hypothetical protein